MRVYLDHNATTPLRAEAREAMLAAMDVAGNPSSVHAEGRAAKGVVERARAQVAALVGCSTVQVIFTGSATEAATMACAGREVVCADIEHDAVRTHQSVKLDVDQNGEIVPFSDMKGDLLAVQAANSETGVLQDNARWAAVAKGSGAQVLVDAAQLAGRFRFELPILGADFAILSGHKFGAPKGVGALIVGPGIEPAALLRGGGQEMGRRSGTENVIGIAGLGAAAEAAARDVAEGRWDQVAEHRDLMEDALEAASNHTILVGKGAPRLPNTSCILTPGWKGETQVMQMDLAGFAISAGSACSSGKVKASTVLRAMGYDDLHASSAIRVSLGLETTREDVLRFADAWTAQYKKHAARAA